MSNDGNQVPISDNDNGRQHQYEVHDWLLRMSTERPLMDSWLQPGDGNHVRELYEYEAANQSNTPALWVWVIGALSLAVICMCILLLIGIGKCCKWEPSHGRDFNLWSMTKNGVIALWKKVSNKRCKNDNDVGDPYEKPINIELDEIIVYQEGRRVTLESDEHTQLLREARLSESEPNSPFFPRFSNFDTRQSNATTTPTPSNSSSKNNNATHNIFNFSPERTKSPSLKAKMAFQKIRCLTKTAVSSFYETPDSSNNTDSKTGEGEDFQTRPLPPLPTSSEFNLQQKSPFKVHSLFNTSLDEQCQASHGETKTKLKYEELEQYLQRNSSHSDLLYAVDFTSKRKNTVSEFRKHRSTYNKNRRQVVAAQVTRAYLARQRSSSIDERLSQTSLNRKGNLTRRSRSLDDLLDNITVNQIYVDIKTAYETVPDNLRRKQQKPRPKKPPRLFYESYRAQNSFQEMCSPRDGGMTVSTNTLYGTVKGENEYALITDLPEVAKKLNIQKRPMPPTPTLLDMCFMRRSPATEKNSLIKGNVNALRTPITGAVGANPNEDCHYHAPVLLDHSGDVPTGNEDHYHNIRVRRHLSVQFPSFRSNISGSSGAYAKIPDLMAGGGGKDQS